MEDSLILNLYEARDERALSETSEKYGSFCSEIAGRILLSPQDTEECVSDVLMQVWNRIPPEKPKNLPAFLTVLTRNAAITAYRKLHREKRGSGQLPMMIEEFADVIPAEEDIESEFDRRALRESLEAFLRSQPDQTRRIFVLRYIAMLPTKEIAERFGLSDGSVRVSLLRTRKKLREHLKKEGFV